MHQGSAVVHSEVSIAKPAKPADPSPVHLQAQVHELQAQLADLKKQMSAKAAPAAPVAPVVKVSAPSLSLSIPIGSNMSSRSPAASPRYGM